MIGSPMPPTRTVSFDSRLHHTRLQSDSTLDNANTANVGDTPILSSALIAPPRKASLSQIRPLRQSQPDTTAFVPQPKSQTLPRLSEEPEPSESSEPFSPNAESSTSSHADNFLAELITLHDGYNFQLRRENSTQDSAELLSLLDRYASITSTGASSSSSSHNNRHNRRRRQHQQQQPQKYQSYHPLSLYSESKTDAIETSTFIPPPSVTQAYAHMIQQPSMLASHLTRSVSADSILSTPSRNFATDIVNAYNHEDDVMGNTESPSKPPAVPMQKWQEMVQTAMAAKSQCANANQLHASPADLLMPEEYGVVRSRVHGSVNMLHLANAPNPKSLRTPEKRGVSRYLTAPLPPTPVSSSTPSTATSSASSSSQLLPIIPVDTSQAQRGSHAADTVTKYLHTPLPALPTPYTSPQSNKAPNATATATETTRKSLEDNATPGVFTRVHHRSIFVVATPEPPKSSAKSKAVAPPSSTANGNVTTNSAPIKHQHQQQQQQQKQQQQSAFSFLQQEQPKSSFEQKRPQHLPRKSSLDWSYMFESIGTPI